MIHTAKLKDFTYNPELTVDGIKQRLKRAVATMHVLREHKEQSPAVVVVRYFKKLHEALETFPDEFAAVMPFKLLKNDGKFEQAVIRRNNWYFFNIQELIALPIREGSKVPAQDAKVFSCRYP